MPRRLRPSLLEAMACGAPVIVSGRGSLPEVVGEAALLADPRDALRIGEALRRLLADKALRQGLAAEGVRRARLFTGICGKPPLLVGKNTFC